MAQKIPYCGFILSINGTYANILAQEFRDPGFSSFLYTEEQLKKINDKVRENSLFILNNSFISEGKK